MDRRWFALDSDRPWTATGHGSPGPLRRTQLSSCEPGLLPGAVGSCGVPGPALPCPANPAQGPARCTASAPRCAPRPGPGRHARNRGRPLPTRALLSLPAARRAKDTHPPLPGAIRRIARYRIRRVRAGSAAANLQPRRLLPWRDRGRPARTAAEG